MPKTLQELLAAHRDMASTVAVFHGSLRRVRAHAIARAAKRHFDDLAVSNEAIRRLPQAERDRIRADIQRETTTIRRSAASVARHHVRAVHHLADEAREFIAGVRRDTSLTFPDALDNVTADGMIALALLRLQMAPMLAQFSAPQLLDTYTAALARRDARGLVEAELVEDLATRDGAQLAAAESDLPTLRTLREYIEGVMDLRLPLDLPDFDGLAREADRLNALADGANVHPTNPEHDSTAALVFENERAAMTEAGEKSHADDQRYYLEEAS